MMIWRDQRGSSYQYPLYLKWEASTCKWLSGGGCLGARIQTRRSPTLALQRENRAFYGHGSFFPLVSWRCPSRQEAYRQAIARAAAPPGRFFEGARVTRTSPHCTRGWSSGYREPGRDGGCARSRAGFPIDTRFFDEFPLGRY